MIRSGMLLIALSASVLGACEPPPVPPPVGSDCRKTGCSEEVCAAQDVVTTCEWRPQYACYRAASCRRLSSGECGFVRNATLDQCLAQTGGCMHRGQHHDLGGVFPAGDGCNTCSCGPGGRAWCTLIYCPRSDAGAPD